MCIIEKRMIDFGNIIKKYFPEHSRLLIDLSHILIGMIAYKFPIVIALFVIYQIFDIKEGDNIRRDFTFFGVGYGVAYMLNKK